MNHILVTGVHGVQDGHHFHDNFLSENLVNLLRETANRSTRDRRRGYVIQCLSLTWKHVRADDRCTAALRRPRLNAVSLRAFDSNVLFFSLNLSLVLARANDYRRYKVRCKRYAYFSNFFRLEVP